MASCRLNARAFRRRRSGSARVSRAGDGVLAIANLLLFAQFRVSCAALAEFVRRNAGNRDASSLRGGAEEWGVA